MAKVLVVDDAAFMRVRAARALHEAGHEVTEAGTGRPDRALSSPRKLPAA